MDIETQLKGVFADAGADGFMHVVEIDGDAEAGLGADTPVVMASVFKVPVLLELVRQAWAGELELTERVVVTPDDRVMGPTGLSGMLDETELSLRDLAFLMMSISDNTATDVIMRRLGLDRINATIREVGLERTEVVGDCNLLLTSLIDDLGLSAEQSAKVRWDEIDPAAFAGCRSLDPEQTTRTTPREITKLLKMIWLGEAAHPEACAEIRRILHLQAWRDRLSSGFPDGILVAGKTGTLPAIRNEVGVVEYSDGKRYAAGVFTKAQDYRWRVPPIDAVIGTSARMAIDHIRSL